MTDARPPALAAYLDRIGVPDAAEPDLATLRRIVTGHATTIPFEGLDPLTGVEPGIDADALTAKLVRSRRGGWCFEHNGLLRTHLDALGYDVTGLAARVRWMLPDDAPPTTRTHMLLRVELAQGSFLADVGFGGMTPTGVLALEPEVEQETPLEPYRLHRDGDTWTTTARTDRWRPLYTFDLVPAPQVDYEMGNWYLAHHPDSPFRANLIAALPGEDRRRALGGRAFTVHHLGGPSERRELESPGEIRDVLETEFGIDTALVAGLDDRLADLFPS
ncbi:arylamine N-acetyltransferase [Pseudonocardia sp. KRD291]|uniref:arylamine N-acetyltransferase family protein n=1 Tax=Pseudonocardia sp. KRD291 TaxID=2792007 RepID=UPI001C4A4426|nr:arylamine N-acetyltransferase [Pseudonocardia sp. KRD291]MBW0104676.1 arylamine N-acetyltransferase [Pseudonocardia sp. KRD291]